MIAEVGQAHDGSLGAAHAFIDLAADCGADAVKFQTHIAAAESTALEPWRIKFSMQDETRYDYWRRMEFSPEQWAGLKRHADERSVTFLSSPFSIAAVQLLRTVGVAAWKVASGEICHHALLESMLEDQRPILLSSGLSGWAELDAAVARTRLRGSRVAVMQCTTEYPTPPSKVGLNVMEEMRTRYECPVGLSDHSGSVYAPLAAATLGASCVEVHITFHKGMFGPDTSSSLDPQELRALCEGVKTIHQILTAPVNKDLQSRDAAPLRNIFGRSVVLDRPVTAGTRLERSFLSLRKPGTGIPPERLDGIVGRVVRNDLPADHVLSYDDIV